MDLTPSSLYAFGPFELDPVNRLLLRESKRVAVMPKAFDMLLLLVEGRGDVLTKDQLMSALWPDTFVEEANLTQHVATLRKVLGELNGTLRYIETLPKRGYRFVAPVHIAVHERPEATPRLSLAVLPFNLFGTEAADSFLGLSIADTLITKLGQSRHLTVRSTSAIAKYEGEAPDAPQAGRLLSVDFVLTGTVSKSEGSFRINLQLVRVSDEVLLWAQQLDLTCANVFAVENMIVRRVEGSLLGAMTGSEKKPRRKRHTRSGAAYQAYLKGRYFWNKRSENDIWKGIECFKEAIKIDPNFALAHTGLADSYGMLINYGAVSPVEAFPMAKEATLKALELDASLGEAHASMGYISVAHEWDWDACEREFLRAIDLNPRDITPRHWYASFLTIRGRWDQALVELDRAREIDPLSLILGAITGWTLYLMRRYDHARDELLKTLDLEPNYYLAHLYLARVCVMQDRTTEAIAEFQKALAFLTNNAVIFAELAHAHLKAGLRKEGVELLGQLLEEARHRYVPPYFLALVHAGLEDHDQAFARLEEAYAERHVGLFWFKCEPRFDVLRDDPRYEDLLRRIGHIV